MLKFNEAISELDLMEILLHGLSFYLVEQAKGAPSSETRLVFHFARMVGVLP
jgi:hypothetical protein